MILGDRDRSRKVKFNYTLDTRDESLSKEPFPFIGNITVRFFTIVLVFLPLFTHASFGFKLDGTLDKPTISKSYFEGDFERIKWPLEEYLQHFPASATKEDSIFVYKYLSVIYAADSSTRKKGESCMVQLIKMKPTIELIDLYISDNIAAIFKDVKQSYFQQQKYIREHDVLGNEKKDTIAVVSPKTRSKEWLWWTLGGVGTATIITGTILALNQDSNKSSSAKIRIEL